MNDPDLERGATTEGLPIAPLLGDTIESARIPVDRTLIEPRVVVISLWAIGLAILAGFIAQGLVAIIALVTNLSFYGRLSFAFVSPAQNRIGLWVIVVPVIGGVIVGLMARYGSKAIRGHGIPEAMEQVLINESRIPPRVTLLKPISAAISIGTGGPFGAEGPIIATGGALGSVLGQITGMSTNERKTLLAAGAAAGMAATFGSPVAAVLLAIELLLFEYRPRSIIPVALASATATGVRMLFVGSGATFAMPMLARPTSEALAMYAVVGAIVGWISVYVTRSVYWIEDRFETLPIHWMWWPAIGGLVVGTIGYMAPRTLGVGYDNIEGMLTGKLAGETAVVLCLWKFLSWSISLGSGTSGGTMAPLFTLGGGCGILIGEILSRGFPHFGIDPRICALVGMAAMFAGASRALLTSVVFAFETTLQPIGLLPLLGGCTAGYLVSSLLMRNTIMTEKLARRGVRVPAEYAADYLDRFHVGDCCSRDVVTLRANQRLADASEVLGTHQGFPVVDDEDRLIGVITRRDFLGKPPDVRIGELITRPPSVVFVDSSLRDAADHMVRENVGRLAVVNRDDPRRVVGFITRSDLLSAHSRRLTEQ